MCTSYFFNKCALCVPICMQSSGNNSLNEHISPGSAFRYGVFKKHKGVRAEIGQVNGLEICGGRDLYVFTCVRPEVNIKCLSQLLSALLFETESLNLNSPFD